MPRMDTFTLVNTRYLEWLNSRSYRRGAQRLLSPTFLKKVDPSGLHVVMHNFLVDPDTVRCTILVKQQDRVQPAHATLDLSYSDYRELPRFSYNENGDVIVEPNTDTHRRYRNIAQGWARRINTMFDSMDPPEAEDALTFDEVEAAGLDGTLRDR